MKIEFSKIFLSNIKIKSLAFFVSFIFWFVILGQRSIIVSREIPLEFLIDPRYSMISETEKVTINFSAKRSTIQSFVPESASPVIDLRTYPPGENRIGINLNLFNMPVGARILSVEPKRIDFYLKYNVEKSIKDRSDSEGL